MMLSREIADSLDGIPTPAEHVFLEGHGEALRKFEARLNAERLHHAWLLCGPRGIGKASLAFRLAGHLLRGGKETISIPALDDEVQHQIANGSQPNLLHLTRSWDEKQKRFRQVLTIDEVRRAGDFLLKSRARSGWRVVIVDAADEMNNNAANALLKLLEEPPPDTLFLVLAHRLALVKNTIRSRCQRVMLRPLERDVIRLVLERFSITEHLSDNEIDAILDEANGSVRQAILFARGGGLALLQRLRDVHSTIQKPNWNEISALADFVTQRGQEDRYRLFLELASRQLENKATNISEPLASLARWGEVWEKMRLDATRANSVNLDRKQVVLNYFNYVSQATKTTG